MIKFLQGEKIYLRALEKEDVNQNYLSWLNQPDVTSGLVSGTFPTTLDGLSHYVESKVRDRNTVMLAICDQQSNKHIGNIKLDNFDWVNRTCELGILIGEKDFWGKGIGYEACYLTIRYAFETLNIRKILLAVYANNPGAIKVYQKIGFKTEGVLRKHIFANGEYIDKMYMGLFKEEFQ